MVPRTEAEGLLATQSPRKYRMDPSEKPPHDRPPSEQKTNPANGNLIWYVLAASLIALVLVSVVQYEKPVEIAYGQLVNLIEQGAPERNPQAAIEIEEGSEDQRQTVRYSDLKDLRIGPNEITGTVTRQVLAPKEDEPKKDGKPHRADFREEVQIAVVRPIQEDGPVARRPAVPSPGDEGEAFDIICSRPHSQHGPFPKDVKR